MIGGKSRSKTRRVQPQKPEARTNSKEHSVGSLTRRRRRRRLRPQILPLSSVGATLDARTPPSNDAHHEYVINTISEETRRPYTPSTGTDANLHLNGSYAALTEQSSTQSLQREDK